MRSVLLIAAIIVLIGGAMLFLKNDSTPNESVEATTTPQDDTNQTENSDEPEDMDMDDMNMAETEETETEGNDAGMEFPETDMTIPEEAKIFEVSGTNFEYNISEIKVKQGDTVTINFTSEDGFHDWVVDAFDAKTARVKTGGKTSVTFVADQKGTFEYYCSVGSHRANGMVGKLIVE